MPYDARRMAGALKRKLGAQEESGRHMHYKVYYKDCLVGATLISHGAKEISDGLASSMAKQLCITLRVLDRIYACPGDWAEYREAWDANRNPSIPYRAPWS